MKPYKGRRPTPYKITTILLVFIFALSCYALAIQQERHEAEKAAWQAKCEIVTEYIPVPDVRVVRVVVTSEATPEPTPIETPEPTPTPRLTLTDTEIDLIARIVWHEARGESAEGQRAVVEVIFNRIEADNFPDTVEDVIFQKNQFASAEYIDSAEPSDEQYQAIVQALYGEPMLPGDVVYFSQGAENDRVWGVIGGHTFCYQYVW